MKGDDRREQIFELVRRRGFVVIEALARQFGVSSQTIRRDINALCGSHLLVRHHGGAGLAPGIINTDYAARRISQISEKEAIAEAIADYIPDGASLFMTIGTTMEIVARALSGKSGLRIITNNLPAASALHPLADLEVSVPGGTVRSHNGGIVGATAIQFLEQFRVDFAVMSTGAVEDDGTFLDFYADEVTVARAMMNNARRVLLAVDSSKFSRRAPVRQGHLSEVSALFTDRIPHALASGAVDAGTTEMHLCGGHPESEFVDQQD